MRMLRDSLKMYESIELKHGESVLFFSVESWEWRNLVKHCIAKGIAECHASGQLEMLFVV